MAETFSLGCATDAIRGITVAGLFLREKVVPGSQKAAAVTAAYFPVEKALAL